MARTALIGALVFGVSSAIAGFLWVGLEFPWAVLVPAALGWFAVVKPHYGQRKALVAAAVGGVLFTIVFITAMFVVIADGSQVYLPAWVGPTLAAAVAGAAVGVLLERIRGMLVTAGYSAVAMAAATAALAFARNMQPATVQQPGVTQTAWAAGMLLIVGLVVGAGVGAAVARISSRDAAPSTA